MLAFIVLLAAQTSALAPPVEQEIVVTTRRLKDWRGRVSANARGSRCKTTRSTGNPALDQIACDTLRHCTASMTAEFQIIGKLPRPERDARLSALNAALEACGDSQQRLRVADYLAKRRAGGAAPTPSR